MPIRLRCILSAAAITLLLAGCAKPIPQRSAWNGTMVMAQSRALPFRFILDLTQPQPSGVLINADEQTIIPEIRVSNDSIIFTFSEYRALMAGSWDGSHWKGMFVRFRAETLSNVFEAMPEQSEISTAPASGSESAHALAGTFRVFQQTDTGIDSAQLATFWTRGDSVFGTFIAPDGDLGLFAGVQTGERAVLNRFTGWQASVMELCQDGLNWTVELFGRSGPAQAFRLEPRPSRTALIDGEHRATLVNPRMPFQFMGVTVSGDTIRNSDARFRGKALIIDIMGTWCHNCMDAAPVLQELYRKHGPDGLEIVGLCFEMNDDPALARKNLSLYQQRYGITFPVMFCGSTQDRYVAPQLRSQIKDFGAYPTTLFVGREGRVRQIHIGFRGPGTGDQYQDQVRQYHEITETILR